MTLLSRIKNIFSASCDHETEIHSLRNQLQASICFREFAERRVTELLEEITRITAHRDLLDAQVTDLTADVARRLATIEDLALAMEELTNRLAIAEATADAEIASEQLTLRHAPFVEPAGESPILEDKLVSDTTCEQAYRLVGIWFEGKSHWVMARGDERVKAPIHDRAFLDRMQRHEVSFIPGDTLRAEFRIQTFQKPNGGEVYAIHSVERVLEIIHPDEQTAMPFAAEEAAHA